MAFVSVTPIAEPFLQTQTFKVMEVPCLGEAVGDGEYGNIAHGVAGSFIVVNNMEGLRSAGQGHRLDDNSNLSPKLLTMPQGTIAIRVGVYESATNEAQIRWSTDPDFDGFEPVDYSDPATALVNHFNSMYDESGNHGKVGVWVQGSGNPQIIGLFPSYAMQSNKLRDKTVKVAVAI